MSTTEIFNEVNHLSIPEKLALIEQFVTSEETLYSSGLLHHDPSWNFLKDSAEDIYSLQHIKEKR